MGSGRGSGEGKSCVSLFCIVSPGVCVVCFGKVVAIVGDVMQEPRFFVSVLIKIPWASACYGKLAYAMNAMP